MLSCHAIASRLAVALREGWLASAEAISERRIKREPKLGASQDRTREMISFDSTVQRFNDSPGDSPSCRDHPPSRFLRLQEALKLLSQFDH
jgi:hypothetical protein